MAEEVYIADDLKKLLDRFAKLGDFPTRVKASEVLAVRILRLPMDRILPDQEEDEKGIEGDFLRIK